ncbi:MAG: GntR family transcriptional regulator [Bryobacteraceae bacterium]|nr:GntR family transcriptional regulator [Bryobacteraceae bacterium]
MQGVAPRIHEVDGSPYGITGIRRKSLKSAVIEQILDAIHHGRLRPGTRVTELGLAKAFGISQSTVREAFIELEHQGFIQRLGPRMTCITELSAQEVREIYRVRARLEIMVVEVLLENGRPQLSEAETLQRQMARMAEDGDVAGFLRADLGFHRALWKACGNRTLADVLERMAPRLFALSLLHDARPSREHMLRNAAEHRRLLAHLRSGNAAAALALVDRQMKPQQALLGASAFVVEAGSGQTDIRL